MTDEEMAGAWETGDYTWGDDLGGGGSTDDGVDGDNSESTDKVWSPIHGGFVDPSILDETDSDSDSSSNTDSDIDPNSEPDRGSQIPSFGCPSGYAYPDGTCVPVDGTGSGGDSSGGDNDGDSDLETS